MHLKPRKALAVIALTLGWITPAVTARNLSLNKRKKKKRQKRVAGSQSSSLEITSKQRAITINVKQMLLNYCVGL